MFELQGVGLDMKFNYLVIVARCTEAQSYIGVKVFPYFSAGRLAHDVVGEHVRGAELLGADDGADDRVRRQRRLEHVPLEPPGGRGGGGVGVLHPAQR